MAQDEYGNEDARFAVETLSTLPPVDVSAGLAVRILADFDRVVARRHGTLRRFADLLWPGAPLWQPATALALSLICGLTAGGLLPGAVAAAAQTDQLLQISDIVTDQDQLGDGS